VKSAEFGDLPILAAMGHSADFRPHQQKRCDLYHRTAVGDGTGDLSKKDGRPRYGELKKVGKVGHMPHFGKYSFEFYLAIPYTPDKLRAFTPLIRNLGLFCSSEYCPDSNLQWSVQE
jgi:hypothetical protein